MARHNSELEAVKALVKELRDGGWNEADIQKKLEEMVHVNLAEERRRRAKQLIDRATRMRTTEPDGQMSLPGFDPYPNEPMRLIRNGRGQIIEQRRATPQYKAHEMRIKSKNAHAASYWARVTAEEFALYNEWYTEHVIRGGRRLRNPYETWIKEAGYLKPKDSKPTKKTKAPEPPEDDDV